MMVMLRFMQTTIFYILRTLNPTCSSWVFLLLTIFTLKNTQIYVCISNCSNITSNVEAPINKIFGLAIILNILNVEPCDSYIWFQGNFNNSWSWCYDYIIKDVVFFDNSFDYISYNWDVSIFKEIWNTYDF